MLELAIVTGFGLFALYNTRNHEDELRGASRKIGERLGKLWDIAHQSMRESRFLRAEKALLTILKIDERNAAAYNRLGILYAKQKEYRDAIDCFEIASSIEATPSSLHNLGLIYYETENYAKAAIAFEKALGLEEKLAARHIAYAKVQEKLGNDKLMIQSLNRAVELEPSQETYELLQKAYRDRGYDSEADMISQKLQKMANRQVKPQKHVQHHPKRVV
jgi:tetratricopeptide (TPR) repeat protein